MNNEQFLQK